MELGPAWRVAALALVLAVGAHGTPAKHAPGTALASSSSASGSSWPARTPRSSLRLIIQMRPRAIAGALSDELDASLLPSGAAAQTVDSSAGGSHPNSQAALVIDELLSHIRQQEAFIGELASTIASGEKEELLLAAHNSTAAKLAGFPGIPVERKDGKVTFHTGLRMYERLFDETVRSVVDAAEEGSELRALAVRRAVAASEEALIAELGEDEVPLELTMALEAARPAALASAQRFRDEPTMERISRKALYAAVQAAGAFESS